MLATNVKKNHPNMNEITGYSKKSGKYMNTYGPRRLRTWDTSDLKMWVRSVYTTKVSWGTSDPGLKCLGTLWTWAQSVPCFFRQYTIFGDTLNHIMSNKKALLSQRRPRDAPNIWVHWKVSRVLANAPGYFSRNL